MKIQVLILLFGCICFLVRSQAFNNSKSVPSNGVIYAIGKKGNDCGVTATENGKTIEKLYTSSLTDPQACVPLGIFVFESKVVVIFNVTYEAFILTADNSVDNTEDVYTFGDAGSLWPTDVLMQGNGANVFATIETSRIRRGFFTSGIYQVTFIPYEGEYAPMNIISFSRCSPNLLKMEILLPPNYELANLPTTNSNNPNLRTFITGSGWQVFDVTNLSFTSFDANSEPLCLPIEDNAGSDSKEEEESIDAEEYLYEEENFNEEEILNMEEITIGEEIFDSEGEE